MGGRGKTMAEESDACKAATPSPAHGQAYLFTGKLSTTSMYAPDPVTHKWRNIFRTQYWKKNNVENKCIPMCKKVNHHDTPVYQLNGFPCGEGHHHHCILGHCVSRYTPNNHDFKVGTSCP